MKRCALINDISGFGNCSLSAALPIISVMGIEAHAIPTAVFSNQTSYESFAEVKADDYFPLFFAEWEKLSVSFDAIITGYFRNESQVAAVREFASKQKTLLIVDPVMADNGSLYDGFGNSLCQSIKELAFSADIVTPNLTELRILSGCDDADSGAQVLLEKGVRFIVVTGVESEGEIGASVYSEAGRRDFFARKHQGHFSGTGDIFTSVLAGKIICGFSVFEAAELAVNFVSAAAGGTQGTDYNNGVAFEKYIRYLL